MIRYAIAPVVAAAIGLALAIAYGGPATIYPVLVLIVLEISFSFDNAVVNATILTRMSHKWQVVFLTVGVVLAVFVVRLVLPIAIVEVVTGLTPARTIALAVAGGNADQPGTFAHAISLAHPEIAAFGGVFLLALFLDFLSGKREIAWVKWIEIPFRKAARFNNLTIVCTLLVVITVAALQPAQATTVLLAGICGLTAYLLVGGLGSLLEGRPPSTTTTKLATGFAGLALFAYLELIDTSFSLDGVVGAFAVTDDPIVIAVGLGIGAVCVRTLTVILVRKGALRVFPFLEHGGYWAIGALAVALLVSITVAIPQAITGSLGIAFIAAAVISSIRKPAAAAQP